MILTDVLKMPLLGVLIHMNRSYKPVSSIYYLYRPEILLKIKSNASQKDFKNAARYITFTPKMNSLEKIGLNGKNEQIRGRLDFRSRFLDFRSRFWYEL